MRLLPSMTFCACWHDSIPIAPPDQFSPKLIPRSHDRAQRTLDRLAIKRRSDLAHRVRDLPVLVPDLDQPLHDLRRVPRRLDDVRLAAGDGLLRGRPDDERLGAHGGEAVDVRAEVELDDVALGERLARGRVGLERGEVRDGVVDGDAGRERDACRAGAARVRCRVRV